MISAISVKDRLKKQAIEEKKTMQDKIVMYGLERTIYRLSISEYAERFTLKGGIFLYALFNGDYTRATTDIDLLAQCISNDVEEMEKVFKEIFSIKCDDALHFDLNTLDIIYITEFKEYHGVKVSILGHLDKTKVPISIDIGFGDIVYPERMKMDFPVLLDMDIPKVYAYSINSVVAEKFEAFVSLGLANSRYKDFYDIYVLADRYNFDGTELMNAIKETFNHRSTSLEEIVAFEDGFADDETRLMRWNSFVKKKKALIKLDFEETVQLLKILLFPIVDAIKKNELFERTWSHEKKMWS